MNDEIRNRACINDVYSNTSTSKHPKFSRLHKGAYVTACMKAMQYAKIYNDVETIHLKLHPIPSIAYDYASDTVPNLGDDQCKTMYQLITETKSSSIKMHKCATSDDSPLGDDMLSDSTSSTPSMTNSYDYEANFYDDDTLDSDENTMTS